VKPISEERQRTVYEWAYPELKGKDWYLRWDDRRLDAAIPYDELHSRLVPVQPLYLGVGGQPNYQWFFTEAVPKLVDQGIEVYFSSPTYLSQGYVLRLAQRPKSGKVLVRDDTRDVPDPIAALAKYVEAI